ncbi:mucin-binding protein [Limosilactobacillus reuteri]|uniref:mucin-binding protein n=1 Tax=Limosilactobacillus reuteri TaxID=1598 RepID=UPI001C1087AB|nr:YSIRK-type signal peptide-containing protein [Limosilactobacillus reuteri]MBU5282927.1 YSIRK-type signal peptide-containing protein [Limosilactobacillus reuteri]
MLSKNNNRELQRKIDDRQERFTLRKLSIGVASVLLGSFIMGTQLSQTAYASNDNSTAITETMPQASLQGSNDASNQSSAPVSASSNQNNQVRTASEKVTATSNNSSSTNSSPAAKTATASSQSSQTSAGLTNNNPSSTPVMAASGSSDSIQTLTNNSQASLNTQQASITDAPDYPNTNGIVPQNQYIFDQFHLTNGQLTDNAYTPLNMVITLATNRNEPGGILNYYITNDQYTQQYSNGTINVGEMQTYEGPYQGSKINIYNFGENGISVNELNNNYGLAFTFGYGKYQALIKENPNPYAADSVSNAWGDAMPEKVTQTIKYVNEKTGEEISGIQPYTQTGLTGQVYSAGKNDQIVIKGYYLVNSSRANGIISQFHNGGTYTNEWVSASGQLIKEVWHQISQNGLMQCDIYINGQQQYDPNNLKGIVYPSSQSSLVPTSLSIQNGNYVFPNPYVEQTQNIELKYLPLGKIIPVLPNGEVIPNAPQPQYQNNPNDPTGVKPDEPVPVIPGYTPQEQTVTPEDPGKDTQVIYTPIQQGSITVTVHDVTDNVNLPQYGKSSGEQDVGTGFTYDKNTVITDLENKGYKVLNPDVVIPATISKGAQNIVINVEHELVPVTPENPGTPGQPINPNDPDGPKWPDGTAKNDLEVTGTQTIHYEGAGDKTPADNTQHFTFTKSATVDKVTGKIVSETGWNVASHTFGNVDTPVVAGYHADKAVAGGATITPDDLNKTIVVTYAPNGHVIPVGPDGTPIPGADQPQFPTNPDNPTGTTPSEVPVVPGYHPETGKPGDPVDPVPGQPGEDVPVKYVPDTPTPETYTGSQTIKFVDGTTGKEIETPNVQTTPDLTSDHTFGKINTPVIKGYTTTQTTAGGATVTKNNPNATITVTYTPNGHVIPVGPDGTPIPGADQPQFPTNPDNPSETTPGQVPNVPGYHPETGKPGDPVDPVPGQPGEDVPVKYVPDTPVEQGSITVTVRDTTDNVDLPQYGKSSGEENVGTTFTYDKNTVIQELENKGYKVLNPDVVIPTTISKGAQNIVINVEHQLVPVTPENPGQPGQPINPNDPNGPKWPDGTAKDNLEVTGTQTIHYVGAGDQTPANNVQHFTFTKSAVVDKVTGKIVSETDWNVASHTFGNINTPVVPGYHADKAVAGGTTITPDDLNKTVTVTYTPNGHIIPVGPDGKPLPNVPQPQYPTNPNNPTEVTPNEPVPEIPGYTPNVSTVTPENPGENTPVVYTPNEKPVGPTTPSENGTPNGNTGNPTTPQPETPAKPMTPTTTPAGNGNIPTNGQTTFPAGSSVTTSNVNNANAITPAAQKQAAQLPQTGNEQLKHEGILGLLALGVAGLLAFGKKRRKE